MNLNNNDLVNLFLSVTSLLIFSHFFGYLFQRYRQPQVVGEIFGGLLLGPSCLQLIFPSAYSYLFNSNPIASTTLGVIYNSGLLLLMFCSGLEMNSSFPKEEKKTSLYISVYGFIISVILSIGALSLINVSDHIGIAGNLISFKLVCITAIAITSIPVISRIFYDLGVLNTSFARIVISSAVLEDIILYVIISIALSLSGSDHNLEFSLPNYLGLNKASGYSFIYHLVVTLLFFGFTLTFGSTLFETINSLRINFPKKRSTTASYILYIMAMSGIAIFLGISPMLGAFTAGIMVKEMKGISITSVQVMKDFSFAFFIPVYFAIVGLKLNLIHAFDFKFFVFFLLIACFIKIISIYIGARAAGENHSVSLNLGVAMNARGGPGIVLASLALDAKIINESFYSTLILLAIATSLIAGVWIGKIVHSGKSLR